MIDSTDGPWLAGLVDGEGCFSLTVKRYTARKRVEFSFKVVLRADDQETLTEAARILGHGRFCAHTGEGRILREGYAGHALCQWFVNTKIGVEAVIECFRAHPLRSKKRRDFEVWAAAFEEFQSRVTSTPGYRGRPRKQFKRIPEDLFAVMEVYAKQLRAVRRYVAPTLVRSIP